MRWRWLGLLRRKADVVTPAGWGTIGLGIVSYLAGVWFGWEELLIVAVGCAIAVIVSGAWVVGRFPLTISRELTAARVAVGGEARAHVDVTNASRRLALARSAFDSVGDSQIRLRLPRLSPGKTARVSYDLPTDRRGVLEVGPIRVTRADPLGLFRRERQHGDRSELVVHPATVACRPLTHGRAKDLDGPTSDGSPQGGIAFHALREYQPGDERRHIHWRATAKTGTLIVRHFVDNRRPGLAIVFDNRASSYSDEAAFELAVSAAASVALTTSRAGQPLRCVGFSHEFGGATTALSSDALLDRFASVDTVSGDFDLRRLVSQVRSGRQQLSSIAIFTGSADRRELMLALHGVRQRKIAVSCGAPSIDRRGSGVTAGGLAMISAGSLDDFRTGWAVAA